MPPFRASCSGCLKEFTKLTGYRSHLRQSQKPACQAVFRHLQKTRVVDSSSSSDENDFHLSDDSDHKHEAPVPFHGDLFGTADDYNNDLEMFGQEEDAVLHEEQRCEEQVEEQELEDAQQAELDMEEAWEPQRPCEGTTRPDSLDTNESQANNEVGDNLEASTIEAYRLTSQHADVHPRIIKYLSQNPSTPGTVLHHETPADIRYARNVCKDAGNDVWAPFASEVDWKIAKWAKLCGTGSTAFTDLLSIEGVCISVISTLLLWLTLA